MIFKKLLVSFFAAVFMSAYAQVSLGDLIKVAGVGAAVDAFGPEINKTINRLQGFKDSETLMTKVVPILSVGKGGYIGAVQVMGPPSLVKKVKAVAQLETDFARAVRLKALIPIESKDVVKDIKRVVGVGVSAIVDMRL